MYPIFDRKIRPFSSAVPKPSEKAYLKKTGSNWEWYNPPENSVPVNFCLNTSLHGLKYLGLEHKHICERLFWLIAFSAAGITATILILGLWNAYQASPIITIFNPAEVLLDEIPFPSVTVCNVNNVQKSKVEALIRKAEQGISGGLPREALLRNFAQIVDINHICESAVTFTERFARNETSLLLLLDEKLRNEIRSVKDDLKQFSNPTKTLIESSQTCEDMILFCLWRGTVRNCSELFRGIETDYGSCCTFNSIPVSLLSKFSKDDRDDPKKLKEWKEANLTTDNLLFTSETKNRTVPTRQLYPGRPAGLSFMLNPDLDEYFCTNTDSEGYSISLNLPLDFPKSKDNGIAVPTNAEVFIGVQPEVTLSEDGIKYVPLEKRNCYVGHEYDLPHYSIYSTMNCLEECIAAKAMKECNCVRYFMPGGGNVNNLCPPSDNCIGEVQRQIIKVGLDKACTDCLPPCNEISYHDQTTNLPIQKRRVHRLFSDYPELEVPHNSSIVHVYFNVDSVYPRLRKERASKTELLSNTGGLLGLCMGFSFLSLLEIAYYCSIRWICRFYRSRSLRSDDEEIVVEDDTAIINLGNPNLTPKQQRWFRSIFHRAAEVTRKGSFGKNKGPPSNSNQDPSLPSFINESFQADFRKTYDSLSVIQEEDLTSLKNSSGGRMTTNYYNWA